MQQLASGLGIIVIIALTIAWSSSRKDIPWRTVLFGMLLQLVLALGMVLFPPGVAAFQYLGDGVTWFLGFARDGAAFLFGDLRCRKDKASLAFSLH
jgi:CNT family concentrative nucleoside transporter